MQLFENKYFEYPESCRKVLPGSSLTYWKSLNKDVESCSNLLKSSLLRDVTAY